MPIKGRTKGHNFERELVKRFRERGFVNCCTSRLESKAQDDKGVDLCFTGDLNIQAKCVEKLGSLHTILQRMPQDDDNINAVFHKRNRQGVVVSMTEDDFWKLYEKAANA